MVVFSYLEGYNRVYNKINNYQKMLTLLWIINFFVVLIYYLKQ